MDLASVVAALASVGVCVSSSAPNSSVQVDSSRACPPRLAGPEPSGTIHDLGQHFQAPCRCVAGWCGSFRFVRWLDLVTPSVSVPCFGVVVCCGAPCCVVPCFAVLRPVGVRCVALRPAGPRRLVPCRAVVCRYVPRRVASCCGVLCFEVSCSSALHCGALRCGVPCCLVLCRVRSVEVSLARVLVRSAGRSVAGWWLGGAVRCGWLAGSVLWGSGCAARAGGSGRCPWGGPLWGPVPLSCVLWGDGH